MNDKNTNNNSIEVLLLGKNTIFSIDDLAYLWGISNNQVLWNKLGYLTSRNKLKRLSRGIYTVTNLDYSIIELGNRLKTPSYLSFDSILSKNGIIYQYDDINYYASNNSLKLTIDGNKYSYKKIKDEILLNPEGLIQEDGALVASLERAYLDTLYLNPKRYFDNESKIDFEQCEKLLQIYNKNILTKEVILRKNATNR